jgi:hypothetical protein
VSLVIPILVFVLVGLVVLVVGAPLRRARRARDDESAPSASRQSTAVPAYAREEIEAAREAKYREIRDAELDFRTGKLSPEDYAAIDTELRAEAIEILDRLERLKPTDA